MALRSEYRDPGALHDRLRGAHVVTADLISQIIDETCRRFRPVRAKEKAARIQQLIGSDAWMDAALALIDLELPKWQVRRIAYDGGEWHCALSRQRELPEWLDQSIETHHEDLPLAILSAFVEARHLSTPRSRTSVPLVRPDAELPCIPLCCDNFA